MQEWRSLGDNTKPGILQEQLYDPSVFSHALSQLAKSFRHSFSSREQKLLLSFIV